jgi:excisionase family DNA binding protein
MALMRRQLSVKVDDFHAGALRACQKPTLAQRDGVPRILSSKELTMRKPTADSKHGRQHRQPPIPRVLHSATKNTASNPHSSPPHPGSEFALLCTIYEELRELRVSLSEIQTWISNMASSPSMRTVRAVSIEAAQAILGCGRTQVYELLRSGALRRAPKVGRRVMINLTNLEAFLDDLNRDLPPKLKRRPAQRAASREAEEILKLVRQKK